MCPSVSSSARGTHEYPALAKSGQIDAGQDQAGDDPRRKRDGRRAAEAAALTAEENSAETLLDRLGSTAWSGWTWRCTSKTALASAATAWPKRWASFGPWPKGNFSGGEQDASRRRRRGTCRPGDNDPPAVLGETLAEAFVRRVLKNPDDVAAADRICGVLSYRQDVRGSAADGETIYGPGK